MSMSKSGYSSENQLKSIGVTMSTPSVFVLNGIAPGILGVEYRFVAESI